MKHYKDPATDQVYAFEDDGSQDAFIPQHLVTITAIEAAELTQPAIEPITAIGLCLAIDTAADAARRAVAGDPLRAVEYERAADQAQAFKAAGYPAEDVPRTVSAWAIGGRTAQQAADSILAESAAYTEALYQIREARLGAKELVRQAMAAGEAEQAQDIAVETIANIEVAVAGVGNN
jgi:hypothetical protein